MLQQPIKVMKLYELRNNTNMAAIRTSIAEAKQAPFRVGF
jgi:hypothetical protein